MRFLYTTHFLYVENLAFLALHCIVQQSFFVKVSNILTVKVVLECISEAQGSNEVRDCIITFKK